VNLTCSPRPGLAPTAAILSPDSPFLQDAGRMMDVSPHREVAMSTAAACAIAVGSIDETLDAVLAHSHDAWIEEARGLLAAAAAPGAPEWERWPVARWLNEGFLRRFLAERALLNELRPHLTVREDEMVGVGEERIAQLRLGLDRLARRRGSAAEFTALAEGFMQALEMWCAEIELAARRIHCRYLSRDARRLLRDVADASAVQLHC
jgi:hypothetical protein